MTAPVALSAGPPAPAEAAPPEPQSLPPVSRGEAAALVLVMAVYVAFQVNAILHHGSWGQDFLSHLQFIARAYRFPYEFWTTYLEGQNNPPLFHLLCAEIFRLTHHVHSLEVISLFTTALNLGGLLLLHRISLRMIASPAVRMAALVFVTFLPAGMIHAVVLAADGVTTPAVVALTYAMVRLGEAGRRTWREYLSWAVLALLALVLAVSVKFTAVSLVPAAAAVIVAAWLGRAASFSRAAAAMLIVVAPAAALGVSTYRHYKTFQTGNLGLDPARVDPFSPETELNVRSILFFRPGDLRLLRDAPQYDAPSEIMENGRPRHELSVHNRYSYAALLHLGVFTDLLNVYQYDPDDRYVGPRSEAHHRRMRLAVKTAVPFTLCALVAVPFMLVCSGYRVMFRRDASGAALPVFTVLTVSFAFFLVIVIFLPLTWALGGGYWLPRLIIPALFGFFLVTFAFLDRTLGGTRTGRTACLVAAVAQALLGLSFLWPWGVNGAEHTPLPKAIASNMAVHAEVQVRFVPRPPGTGEPLLTVGHFGYAEYVFARHDDAGNVHICFNQWGSPDVPEGPPLPADPDRTYRVVIDTDPAARTVLVTVDGREALRVDGWTPILVFRDEVALLENPAGGGLSMERFSGTEIGRSLRVRGGKPWGRGTGK